MRLLIRFVIQFYLIFNGFFIFQLEFILPEKSFIKTFINYTHLLELVNISAVVKQCIAGVLNILSLMYLMFFKHRVS